MPFPPLRPLASPPHTPAPPRVPMRTPAPPHVPVSARCTHIPTCSSATLAPAPMPHHHRRQVWVPKRRGAGAEVRRDRAELQRCLWPHPRLQCPHVHAPLPVDTCDPCAVDAHAGLDVPLARAATPPSFSGPEFILHYCLYG
ncbi:hypothetical protein DFH08DRAFT_951545 [Mycena albidolilacea]|uniref:Uncharacterized protein n=1 Tax=Mycena albidolilacea TaxID=1033008 RepID=A0AAD7EZY5_9AGAR|nr:hypothetical protein DFH08DRAFT_951545 [Mycena albidolilacea]